MLMTLAQSSNEAALMKSIEAAPSEVPLEFQKRETRSPDSGMTLLISICNCHSYVFFKNEYFIFVVYEQQGRALVDIPGPGQQPVVLRPLYTTTTIVEVNEPVRNPYGNPFGAGFGGRPVYAPRRGGIFGK